MSADCITAGEYAGHQISGVIHSIIEFFQMEGCRLQKPVLQRGRPPCGDIMEVASPVTNRIPRYLEYIKNPAYM